MGSAVPDRTIAVVQGEFRISQDPSEVLSTVLGSCVACCLHDPDRKLGGMNHFLLPNGAEANGDHSVRYGLYAMEMLINALMKAGARKDRLQAKIFGGAKMMADLRDIGKGNAVFAKEFLGSEGIACIAESLGGTNARRVVFRPTTGHARMLLVASSDIAPPGFLPPPASASVTRAIELF